MAKKTDEKASKPLVGARQEKPKLAVDELYFRHVDHVERWRQEYESYQTIENKLAALSTFTYEEVDYAPLMERAIFKERVIPDYSKFLIEAIEVAEGKFLIPIIGRIAILILFMAFLIFGKDTLLLGLSGTGVLTMLLLVFLKIQERQVFIETVRVQTQKEIEERIAYEKNKIAEEKKQHEDNEDQRIKNIESLLAGETSTVLAKIENVLSKIKVIFNYGVEINLYSNIPAVKVWLPPIIIIPDQVCTRQSSGRLTFSEKEMRAINKQYLELSASMMIKIMSAIYSHIPNFNVGYVYGMSKAGINIECLIACRLERETLKGACNAANGLEAIQMLKAEFNCNTSLELLPIAEERPKEWDGAEEKLVRRLHVNVFNHAS